MQKRKNSTIHSSTKLVSVIIVNWNGKKWLKNCLDSLLEQTYSNLEILFVDNLSTDDSVNFVKIYYPSVKIIETGSNLGFAGGNNYGYRFVNGEYTYLLNNDTELEQDCIEKLVEYLELHPSVGSLQSKIMLLNDKKILDLVGSYWTRYGFLYYFGHSGSEDLLKYNKRIPVFSNKGASMMLRTSAIEKIGLFDDDFWCYYEETDLCHRLWISGYECWYEPSARMYHANGGTSLSFNNDMIQYHNFKNKLCSFLKCFEVNQLLMTLPLYFLLIILLSLLWLAQGKYRHFVAIHRATLWNMKNLRSTLQKRKIIQELRVVSDKTIFRTVGRDPGVKYFTSLFTGTLAKYND